MVKTLIKVNFKKGIRSMRKCDLMGLASFLTLIICCCFLIVIGDAETIYNEPETQDIAMCELSNGDITVSQLVDLYKAMSTSIKYKTKHNTTTASSRRSETTTTTVTTTITTTVESDTTTILPPTKVTESEATTEEYLLFYPNSMRVHRNNCIYADDNMERVEGNYVEEGRACDICCPDVEFGTVYEEPHVDLSSTSYEKQDVQVYSDEDEEDNDMSSTTEESYSENNGMTFYSNMEGTYYTSDLGTQGCYGTLTSGYSVAINGIAGGTTVYIESDCPGVGGYYQVMDTGGMGYSVVDFFYDSGTVPSEFEWQGRIPISVYICD